MNSVLKRYYGNNRLVMLSIGVWPYQSNISRRVALLVYFLVAGSQFCCKTAFIIMMWPDYNAVLTGITPLLMNCISIIKLFNCMLNSHKMRTLLDKMLNVKELTSNSRDSDIKRRYAEYGRKITTLWIIYIYATLLLYLTMPILPQILGTLGNNTKQLPAYVYYYVDIQKYYYPIFAHTVMGGLLFYTGLVAADTMFAVFVEHACGMFSILGYRLRNAVKDEDNSPNMHPRRSDDVAYANFVACIDRHNEAIEFAELIESAHATSFLMTVALNMLVISCTGVQILRNLSNLRSLIREIAVVSGQIVHLYVENYYAQRLLDHSNSVNTNLSMSNWYRSSLRTKKLLCMVIMRSHVPCVQTAGRFFVMSLESFSMVLRTSLSYFTLLMSMQ